MQTPQTFVVKQLFSDKSGNEIVTRDYSFTLDGKVISTEKESGTEKNTAQWSADKKILTTRSIITYRTEGVGFTETYSLSDNGLALTVQKSDILPGGLSVKQIFNKKQ
jgi:ABC-type phosphonate transport system ATPase subunit